MTKLGESCTYAGEMVEEVSAGSANVCFDERGLVPAVVRGVVGVLIAMTLFPAFG